MMNFQFIQLGQLMTQFKTEDGREIIIVDHINLINNRPVDEALLEQVQESLKNIRDKFNIKLLEH